MALMRRGLASLVAQFSRLSAASAEGAAAALPAPTLASLRSLALPAAQPCAGSSWAASAAVGSSRQYAAAAAGGSGGTPPRLQAAPAEQQQQQQQPAAGGEESLEQIRARIFGTHIGNGLRSGRKVLAKALVGARVASYYPEDPRKADPLMLDMKAEAAKLKLDRLRRRGKAPPKKGAGKRAGKKK